MTPGTPTNVSGSYAGSHQLEGTSCVGCNQLAAHDDVVTNTAQYENVWRYMLGLSQ